MFNLTQCRPDVLSLELYKTALNFNLLATDAIAVVLTFDCPSKNLN